MEFKTATIRTLSMLGSCGAFGLAAVELPEIDDRIVVVTSDLCFYSGLERFKARYPDRLYNVGIAEQNMIGVAAGFAKEGYIPFATTYATFASMRCADQVRVNMGYMKSNVKLVGLTSGMSVGILGATHMSIEDLAVMRSIPNITILSPADCTETVKAVFAAAKHDGPVYLRLGGAMNCPIVYKSDFDYTIGKANVLSDGEDIAIIATGPMVAESLKAAKLLADDGISARVIDMHTIKPLDKDAVLASCKTKLIVTVEEHSVIGGLGGAVSEALAAVEKKPPQLIIGIEDEYENAAPYPDLIVKCGLDSQSIYNKIKRNYGGRHD